MSKLAFKDFPTPFGNTVLRTKIPSSESVDEGIFFYLGHIRKREDQITFLPFL